MCDLATTGELRLLIDVRRVVDGTEGGMWVQLEVGWTVMMQLMRDSRLPLTVVDGRECPLIDKSTYRRYYTSYTSLQYLSYLSQINQAACNCFKSFTQLGYFNFQG